MLSNFGKYAVRFEEKAQTYLGNPWARALVNCDIGLVGKAKGKYTVLVGGRLLGDRLNFIYQDMIPEADVVKSLVPVFTYYKQHRQDNETLGEFCARKGKEDLLAYAQG